MFDSINLIKNELQNVIDIFCQQLFRKNSTNLHLTVIDIFSEIKKFLLTPQEHTYENFIDEIKNKNYLSLIFPNKDEVYHDKNFYLLFNTFRKYYETDIDIYSFNFTAVLALLNIIRKRHFFGTPERVLPIYIDIDENSYYNKILFPHLKTGASLFYLINTLSKNKNKHLDLFSRIFTGYTLDYNKEFIDKLSLFIYDEKANIKGQKFFQECFCEKYSHAFCNSEFGLRADDDKLYDDFEIVKMGPKNKKNIPLEALYIEKTYNALEENGTLVIILPNGILENKIYKYIRKWIIEKFEIVEIDSLYIGAFKPYTNLKSCILKLRKKTVIPNNYKIKLVIYQNEDEIKNRTGETLEIQNSSLNIDNFTPEYYKRKSSPYIEFIENTNTKLLHEVVYADKFKADILKDMTATIRYIEISSVEPTTGTIQDAKVMCVKNAPKRAYYQVRTGDVITTVASGVIGTKSHSSAVITEEFDGCIVSNGFRVLRCDYNVNPYYLWFYLRSNFFLEQVRQHAAGSTIATINEKDLMNIKIILPSILVQEKIADLVKLNIKKLKEAQDFLIKNENVFENLTERRPDYDIEI